MVAAFVLVQVAGLGSREDASALHDAMHAVSGVKTVHFLAGPTDMIVFVEGADMMALTEAVGNLRGLKGVASTDTRIVLSM